MLDEFVLGGHVCETSKKAVLKAVSEQDLRQEVGVRVAGQFAQGQFAKKMKK